MTTLESSFDQSDPGTRKTSGLAVAGLVCSLICCVPFTTIPGIILGVIGAMSIKGNPAKKGMGIAITAIVLGSLFTIGQSVIYPPAIKLIKQSIALVNDGPDNAFSPGFSGDIAGFKASFHGDGASVSDAEVQAFLDELGRRYGTYQGCRIDEPNQGPAEFGSPIVSFPYKVEFSSGVVDATVEIAFSDPQRGGFIMKLYSITIVDPDLGDLVYPPADPADAMDSPGGDSDSMPPDAPVDAPTTEPDGGG